MVGENLFQEVDNCFPERKKGQLIGRCSLFECKPRWDPIRSEVNSVASGKNPNWRNWRINASYARLYLSNSRLSANVPFLGGAAFGSKQVGCALAGIAELSNKPNSMDGWAAVFTTKAGLRQFFDTITAGAVSTIKLQKIIGDGNLAVYKHLYPGMRFYIENIDELGYERFIECLIEWYGQKSPVIDAFRLIAKPSATKSETMEGNIALLKYEQGTVLIENMYNPGGELLKETIGLADELGQIKGVFHANCDTEDQRFIRQWTQPKPRDFTKLNDRWEFMKGNVEAFDKMWNSSFRSHLTEQLQKIMEKEKFVPPVTTTR